MTTAQMLASHPGAGKVEELAAALDALAACTLARRRCAEACRQLLDALA